MLESILYPRKRINATALKKATDGKNILITGASYGIGECTANLLASKNVTLILVARTESKLTELKSKLEESGATIYIFKADFYNQQDVADLCRFLQSLPFDIDIFISNAGKSICRSINDSLDRFHDFTRTMSINYYAPVQLILSLIPSLIKQKGQIINISAINVLLAPAPYWAAYQSSKAAFDNWIKCTSPELKAKGVCISSVYLPLVRTRMIAPNESYKNTPAMQPEQAARIICNAIVKRSRKYTPWWLFFPRLLSLMLAKQWELIMTYRIKKKEGDV